MKTQPVYALCILLLGAAWAIDIVSPQLFVVAILLSVPIALSSVTRNRQFTFWLVVVALAADASAAWYNAFQDHYRWDPIAVGDRLLAALSIILVGFLSLRAQQEALLAGELAERDAHAAVLRDLVYALSHDLRTPLAAARMTMQQALTGEYGELPPQYREILTRSIASNEELRRLAETLLLVARYESGEQSRLREPVDFGALVKDVASDLDALASSKKIALHCTLPANSVYVLGDGAELRRATTNLIANAVTWTPAAGTISITFGHEGNAAVLTVEDNGYGVEDSMRNLLFQRFAGRSRQGAGSGLGLYIVRRIAEGHGGTVQYRPAAANGSIFEFRIPAMGAGRNA